MRPRTTGISATARSQPQQPSDQPLTFKPKSEWKHENDVSVLFLYLPGFTMEQLTITPDYSKRTIIVEGKRRLPNNRLLPVNETFNVPEDCEFLKLDKQFGKGILMLKFPNKSPRLTEATKEDEENDQEHTRINDIGTSSIDDNSVTGVAKSDEAKFVEKKDHIGDGNGKQTGENNIKDLKRVERKEKTKKSSSTTPYKTPNNSTNTKRDDEFDDAKASIKKDMRKEVINGDLKSIANMCAAVLVIMGLGVSLFYTVTHKLIR